ncbi:helicase [Candidatus Poribacteria bacterium]|nr:MAG: helicase [Candidatus Poribacteria bacterium]
MREHMELEAQLKDSLNLPFELRPYQWEGIQFLVQSEGALLADEMGLGKTVQVAVSLEILWHKQQLYRSLVVVPASLKLNWETELRRWAPSLSVQRIRGSTADRRTYYLLPINVLIVSYEEIRLDMMNISNEIDFDVVVLDEAQRIKNPHSKSSLSCRVIKRKRSWALTGTPVENKLNDLISLFRFVKIGVLHQGLSRGEIHSQMRPHFLRRCKRDVLKDLPPIIDQEIPIELQGKQQDAYLRAWDCRREGLEISTDGFSSTNLFSIITRLKQVCNYDKESGESAKLNVLIDFLDVQTADDDKVIVFSQYVDTLNWLALQIEGIPLEIYHGGLTQLEREEILNRFRNDPGPRCLFISLRAGGVGLNIQEASTVVLFDRWWNPALENQAIQRAHRFGRKRPLHVIRFIVSDTIEERISDILTEKQELFENYIETATNADKSWFSRELLEQILEISELL